MINQPCPTLVLPMTGGETFDSQALRGSPFLLYFYPKDATPGCTREANDFREDFQAFSELGVKIFGISRDSLKSHERFKQAHDLPFELVSDSDRLACHAFDVIKQKTMYGKPVTTVERSTFLIDRHGTIVHAWRGVSVVGHVAEVLAFLKKTPL